MDTATELDIVLLHRTEKRNVQLLIQIVEIVEGKDTTELFANPDPNQQTNQMKQIQLKNPQQLVVFVLTILTTSVCQVRVELGP